MNDQSHTLHLSSKKSPPPLLLRLACMAGRRRLHRHVQENGGQNHPFKSHTPTLLRNP